MCVFRMGAYAFRSSTGLLSPTLSFAASQSTPGWKPVGAQTTARPFLDQPSVYLALSPTARHPGLPSTSSRFAALQAEFVGRGCTSGKPPHWFRFGPLATVNSGCLASHLRQFCTAVPRIGTTLASELFLEKFVGNLWKLFWRSERLLSISEWF